MSGYLDLWNVMRFGSGNSTLGRTQFYNNVSKPGRTETFDNHSSYPPNSPLIGMPRHVLVNGQSAAWQCISSKVSLRQAKSARTSTCGRGAHSRLSTAVP